MADHQLSIARCHSDRRILCAHPRCPFCFGEITQHGIAYVDGGFARSDKEQWRGGTYSRVISRSDREQHGPFALTSYARFRYQEAKRQRTLSTFRAPARHGGHERVWPLYQDVEIVCPEHGLQVISLSNLNATPAPYPEDEYEPWRNDPEPDQVRKRLHEL